MEFFTLQTMSNDELNELSAAINKELETRRSMRWDTLVKNVCDAMNALHDEFPYSELNISYQCSECGVEDEIDVLYALCSGRKMKPEDFL